MKVMYRFSAVMTCFCLLYFQMYGQTSSEALRYSTFDVLGTGRSVGTAGSMSALGGDFSLIPLNPAGLGTYRGSEFTLTPGLFFNSSNAELLNSGASALKDTKTKFLLSNLGLVISSRPRSAKWKTSNFAVGLTKVADYHEKFEYSGESVGSVTDRYRELADGLFPGELFGETGLAYNTGAIYDLDEDLIYESDYLTNPVAPLLRRGTFESSGYNTELFFAYAANYNEKIQFGFSVGVPILSYEEEKIYRENDRDNEVEYFNDLSYEEFLSTSGTGFNFKLGMIFKPGKWINIGLAYHSPTWYALTDNFSSNLTYDYTDANNDGPLYDETPQGTFRYNLRTPSTFSGGLGVVLAKSGFISAEIQYHAYDNARFNYSGRGNGNAFDADERAVNNDINNDLSNALTIRTGAEIAIKKFRARFGIELDQSPYSNDSSFDLTYNAGIGFRADRFFIDLGYQLFTLEEGFLPYSVGSSYGSQPVVVRDITNNRFVLTMAYRWR